MSGGDGMTTDKTLADERETIALMRDGQNRSEVVMRSWMASARLHKGPLTQGQKQAVKLILSSKDRVVGVQGYAGTGKTTMLQPRQCARRQERLPHDRAGAICIGGQDARDRGRNQERDLAAFPRA